MIIWIVIRDPGIYVDGLLYGMVLGVEFGSAGTSGAQGLRERRDFGKLIREVNSGRWMGAG